jgi:hypothetical protein
VSEGKNIKYMAATKDQRKLLNRCVMNEIPVFVLTGTDRCAMAALRAYAEAARQMGCSEAFVEDLECNVLPDFRDFQAQEPEKVKLPD